MRFKFLICLFLASLCLFGVSCKSDLKEKGGGHIHSFITLKTDENYHWRECDCGEKREKEEHQYYEFACSCGLEITPQELTLEKSVDGTYYTVTACEATCEMILIPKQHEQIPIKKIGDGAFKNLTALKKVVTSVGLETIGNEAFFGCENLSTLSLAETVTLIGKSAFENSYSLEKINLPNGLTEIKERAFANCKSIKTVEINKNLTQIGEQAFIGCNKITEFIVDKRNENFESKSGNLYTKDIKGLIYFANGKTRTAFSVPTSVEKIYDYAFYGNENLTTLYFSKNLKEIGYKAIYIANLQTINYTGDRQSFEKIDFDGEWLSSRKTVTVYPSGEAFVI